MLLGLLLPPRAEGGQALGTQHHIWGSLLPGAVMGHSPGSLVERISAFLPSVAE